MTYSIRTMHRPLMWFACCALLLLSTRMTQTLMAAETQVNVQPVDGGGYSCTTPQYEARFGADGSLQSLLAGGVQILAPAGGTGPAAGFVHAPPCQ